MVQYTSTVSCERVFVFGRLNTPEQIANPLPLFNKVDVRFYYWRLMKKALRGALVAGTMLATATSGEIITASPAEAASVYTCTDKNGGTIDPGDFDIRAVQHAVGAAEDGVFGPASCRLTITELIEQGNLGEGSTRLKIGPIVLGWLGVSTDKPQTSSGHATESCTLQTTADIRAVQYAIGTATDGNFGPKSCSSLLSKLHDKGLLDKQATSVVLTDGLAEKLGVDNDSVDRAACKKVGKCILVHAVLGKNKLELYQDGVLIDTTLVNTGMKGMRTRNGDFTIGREDFSGDGVHISRDDNGNNSSGRMGDPHYFSRGQAFHWRINYKNGKVGTALLSDTAFPYADWDPQYENAVYDGGFASHGCVHTPHGFMNLYDNSFFISGVKVVIRDQPTN